jgi:hypothetical protein
MSQGDPSKRDYEIPCEMLDAFDIDASAHLSPEERARTPVGEFVREIILPTWEIDCSPNQSQADPVSKGGFVRSIVFHPVEPLKAETAATQTEPELLTFDIDLPAGLSDAEAAAFVTEFVRKLDAAHRARGGSGLRIEKLTLTVDGLDLSHSQRRRIVKLLVPAA